MQQTTPFVAVYTCYNKTNTYTYYVGADPSNAYMTDTAGKAYKLSAEDATAFTDLSFAACLYEGSKAPTLTVGSEAVTPHEYDWRYKRFSGTYTTVARETTDTVLSYRINAKLAMDFDVAPDLFTVRITDGDTEIFNDTYENIVNLQIDESRELLFHVEARWYETEGKSGQGSAVYDFKATVNTPPVFYTTYANEAEFVPGDFFMITAKNIAKDADISFTAEPTINYTPTFFPDGEYYRALIPISYELDSGTYTFTLESDGVSQSFTLNVNTKSFRTVNLTVDASIVNATRTENTLAKFESDLRPIANDAQTVKGGGKTRQGDDRGNDLRSSQRVARADPSHDAGAQQQTAIEQKTTAGRVGERGGRGFVRFAPKAEAAEQNAAGKTDIPANQQQRPQNDDSADEAQNGEQSPESVRPHVHS